MRWSVLLFFAAGSAAASPLDDYIEYVTGTFSSATQAATDSRYDAVTWHTAEIWLDRDPDGRWLYVESWIDGSEAPYMQRISRHTMTDAGEILVERYRLSSPVAFVGAHEDVVRFEGIDTDALSKVDGCDGLVVRAGKGRFEGSTTGKSCPSSYKGASYAVSRSVVKNGTMTNWDRGFNANGELVWGPAAGGYQFERVDGTERCNKPVRMLVFGTIDDRAGFGAYARAIGESGLYEKTGGYYEGITPALEVFEGEPPATRGVVISRFPCLKAAQDFWYSDAYEDIRPLREGIAEFEVLVLPAPPLPEWANR